jgi:hypothetical protein
MTQVYVPQRTIRGDWRFRRSNGRETISPVALGNSMAALVSAKLGNGTFLHWDVGNFDKNEVTIHFVYQLGEGEMTDVTADGIWRAKLGQFLRERHPGFYLGLHFGRSVVMSQPSDEPPIRAAA